VGWVVVFCWVCPGNVCRIPNRCRCGPPCWDRVGPASNIGGHYVILRWGGRGGRGCVLGDVGCRFKVGGGPALRPSGFTGSRGLLSHLVDANLFSIVLQVGGGVVNE
jgi:hypothetical protein